MVLTRTLREKLVELNPDLPDAAYDDAVRQIVEHGASQSLLATNREKYALLRDRVEVTFRNEQGERVRDRLRVFDFDEPTRNPFPACASCGCRATSNAGGRTSSASLTVCRCCSSSARTSTAT